MAQAKTSKKTTVSKTTTNATKLSKATAMTELRKLEIADLNKALIEAKADLVKARKMLITNQLPASHVIGQLRSRIARIHTIMTEKDNERKAQ